MIGESLRIALVFVHVLAAAVWIGGTVFIAAVLVPISRQVEPPGVGPRMLRAAARRFSRIGWAMLLILVLSGIGLLERNGLLSERLWKPEFWSTELGTVLAIKAVLVAIVLVLSYVHDFVLGPRVASALEGVRPGARPQPEALRQRRRLVSLARVNLLLVLAIIALGVMIFRGVPG